MQTYRSTMEKILAQQEDSTVITNPREPGRTLLRKYSFGASYLKFRTRRFLVNIIRVLVMRKED